MSGNSIPQPVASGLALAAASQFAKRVSGAALGEASAGDALAGALHVVDIVAHVADQALAWDTVAEPFGTVLVATVREGLPQGPRS